MSDTKDVMKFLPLYLSIVLGKTELYTFYVVPFILYFVISKGLKHFVGKERPDGLSKRSFPSGHTSSAFLAASYLNTTLGPIVGIPMFIVANIVGITRIYCNRHTLIDIIGGAIVGIFCGYYGYLLNIKIYSFFVD